MVVVVVVGRGECHMHVCVQPSLALPPLCACVAPVGVCVFFVLSTLLHFPISHGCCWVRTWGGGQACGTNLT